MNYRNFLFQSFQGRIKIEIWITRIFPNEIFDDVSRYFAGFSRTKVYKSFTSFLLHVSFLSYIYIIPSIVERKNIHSPELYFWNVYSMPLIIVMAVALTHSHLRKSRRIKLCIFLILVENIRTYKTSWPLPHKRVLFLSGTAPRNLSNMNDLHNLRLRKVYLRNKG